MKAYPWLPEETSTGDRLTCDNCRYDCERKRPGWLCGNWEEAEEQQMDIFDVTPCHFMSLDVTSCHLTED